MMRKIVFGIWILCSCFVVSGCSDKAITFSLQEETVGETMLADTGTGDGKASSEDTETGDGKALSEDAEADTGKAASADTGEDNGESVTPKKDAPKEQKQGEVVYVHVCGAVEAPGVVKIAADSRAEAALLAAGGFREDAAKDYVNLAAKVTDGQQLYFPTKEEAEKQLAENGGRAVREADLNSESGAEAQEERININTAGVERLCTLPGIGEARARAIIDYRDENGIFQSAEDIMQVPGIKQSAYNKLKDKITTN